MSGDYSQWALPHELEELKKSKSKLDVSSAENRVTDPLRLAAGEDTPLASQYTNGLYNEKMPEAIPSRGARGWKNVLAEWKWFTAMMMPFSMAIIIYFVPASQGQLNTVSKDMDGKLEIEKAARAGQNEAVKAQIGALQGAVGDIKEEQRESRKDIKEVLRLIQGHTTPVPAPYVAENVTPQVVIQPETKKKQVRSVKKPAPVAAKPLGILGF